MTQLNSYSPAISLHHPHNVPVLHNGGWFGSYLAGV